jgi:hypothetical protein
LSTERVATGEARATRFEVESAAWRCRRAEIPGAREAGAAFSGGNTRDNVVTGAAGAKSRSQSGVRKKSIVGGAPSPSRGGEAPFASAREHVASPSLPRVKVFKSSGPPSSRRRSTLDGTPDAASRSATDVDAAAREAAGRRRKTCPRRRRAAMRSATVLVREGAGESHARRVEEETRAFPAAAAIVVPSGPTAATNAGRATFGNSTCREVPRRSRASAVRVRGRRDGTSRKSSPSASRSASG